MNYRYVVIVLLSLALSLSLAQATDLDYSSAMWVPGHLIVNFSSETGTLQTIENGEASVTMGIPSVDDLLSRHKVTVMRRIVDDKLLAKLRIVPDFYRLMLLECPEETDILSMMKDFDRNVFVDNSEPDLLRPELDRSPNDPLFPTQWDKELMSCPRAWEFGTGDHDIIVCAIDGGTYWAHEDFYDNLWVNPVEDLDGDRVPYTAADYPGDLDDVDGYDNDSNGRVDDLLGWDFIQNIGGCAPGEDCDSQQDNDPTSVGIHGTHVAGLFGAVGNNGIGLAGVNWHVRLLANRAGYEPASGEGGLIVQVAALPDMIWAMGVGAKVFNLSYGNDQQSPNENAAIQNLWNNGAVVVAAAGNDGVSSLHYPSGYQNVVAVGSTDNGDVLSDFSNFGSWVDIYAPGGGVMSCLIPGYGNEMGTSMASPNAAGVFALLWSMFPDLTNQELVNFVFDHCRSITAQNPSHPASDLGHGAIDAALPLASLYPYMSIVSATVTGDGDNDGRLEPGETGQLLLNVNNDSSWAEGQNIQLTVTSDDPNITVTNGSISLGNILPGQSVSTASNPIQISLNPNATVAYWATLNASMVGDEGSSVTRPIVLRVGRPQTILIADDGAANGFYANFYATVLVPQSTGYNYDRYSLASLGDPTFDLLHHYGIVIWVCGNESSNTLTANNQSVLAQYLDAGGRLLLAGQNIDEDISGTTFYANYLHAATENQAGTRNVAGVSGDVISEGDTLLLLGGNCAGNGQLSPSRIVPVNGGIGFFNYTVSGLPTGVGAIRYGNSTYKTVYFAFGLEAACGQVNTTHYSVIVDRTMQWFGATITSSDNPKPNAIPKQFALHANYPNPFNPTTTLAFDLSFAARVNLRVYDVLGRQVAELVNGVLPAGTHSVSFDGADLASGVYLARLESAGQTATQRMVLLR